MRSIQPFAAPSAKPPSGASCWVCLEATNTPSDPLLRNCACRGSSGFAHVDCIAEHSRRESEAALKLVAAKQTAKRGEDDPRSTVVKAWTTCSMCKQDFCGDMALSMTERWVSATADAGLSDIAFPRFDALQNLAQLKFDVGDYAGAIRDNEHLLEVLKEGIDVVQNVAKASSLPNAALAAHAKVTKYRSDEADVLKWLGMTYVQQVNATANPMTMRPSQVSAGFARGRKCLERAYDINVGLSGPDSPRSREVDQMLSSFRDDGPPSRESRAAAVRRAKVDYRREKKDGNVTLTLNAACTLIHALVEDGKRGEAFKLLDESEAEAKRVLGPDHAETKRMAELRTSMKGGKAFGPSNKSLNQAIKEFDAMSTLDGYVAKATLVQFSTTSSLNGKKVFVTNRAKGGAKYIVLLPDLTGTNQPPQKFKAAPENLCFASGTKIIVQDLKSATHLNGKRGIIKSFDELRGRYVVEVEEAGGFSGCLKPENLEIVFS